MYYDLRNSRFLNVLLFAFWRRSFIDRNIWVTLDGVVKSFYKITHLLILNSFKQNYLHQVSWLKE
jgi:hypothetical protein